MHDKYKTNYKSYMRETKRRRQIISAIIAVLILILLSITIYFLYSKYIAADKDKEINSDNIIQKSDSEDNNSENKDNSGNIEDLDKDKNDEDNTDNGDKDITDEGNTSPENGDNGNNPAGENSTGDKTDKQEYVYGERVPEIEAVSDEYFDDAVFIGNSQIEGISIYSSMKNATVLAGKGIMVDTIFTKEVIKTKNGDRITIMDALELDKYGKIYIMLGANELGWAYDSEFIKQYAKVIDKMKELQPEAKIYVNAIIPVSKEKSEKDKIYNNKNITRFNELILNMTKEKEVYYLDSKEALADEEGNLPSESTTDGVHFSSSYYEKWFNYLKTHTVNN